MGRPKALLPLDAGDTFCARVVETLVQGGVHRVIVVVRPDDDDLAAALGGLSPERLQVVSNPEPERGQLSSLQCGLVTIGPEASAALITLVDVPLVSTETVRRLVGAWRESGAPLVRLERAGRHGHPIIVSREVVDELCRAGPQSTMRDVLAGFRSRALDVPSDDRGAFEDVDTPEEYARLLSRLRREER
jgi:molybdenum cofactor cytidylyltransferase